MVKKTLEQQLEMLKEENKQLKTALMQFNKTHIKSIIEEDKSQYEKLVLNLPFCVHEIDLFGRIISMNPAGLKMMKVKNESDVIGFKYTDAVCSNDRSHVEVLLKKAITEGDSSFFEFYSYGDARDQKLFSTCFIPLKNNNNEVYRVIGYTEDITIKRKNENEIFYLATHDSFTDLHNRYALDITLNELITKNHQLTLIHIDLDNFKYINDSLGHHAGDRLLKIISNRLSKFSTHDMIFRMSGDEFIILNNECEINQKVKTICEALHSEVSKPCDIAGIYRTITCSIGVATTCKGKYSIAALLKNADFALFEAKKRGRNNICYFDSLSQQKLEKKLLYLTEMQKSINELNFSLAFQPIIHKNTNAIRGAECLLRWTVGNKPASPIEFIPFLEETGKLNAVTQWLLEQIVNFAAQHENKLPKHFTFSFNVSISQLYEPEFIPMIKSIVSKLGPLGFRLEMELTENIFAANFEQAKILLNKIHKLGVYIAIDDFGTGFSSLSYLKALPVDTIKIDKSFVDSCDELITQGIIRTVLTLCKNMTSNAIIEGVETNRQMLLLAQIIEDLNYNNVFIQGYYYHKPMPFSDLITHLSSSYD